MQYISSLDQLYKSGSNALDTEVTQERAQEIIGQLTQGEKSKGFKGYASAMSDAIKGMTEIEAFIYLNEILSRLDAHDGANDDNIQVAESEESFNQALTAIGLGDEQGDIQNNLILASDVFKQDDNPSDELYIKALKNPQDGSAIKAGDQQLMQQALSGKIEQAIPAPNNINQPQQTTQTDNVSGVYTAFTSVFESSQNLTESPQAAEDLQAKNLGVSIIRDPESTGGQGQDDNKDNSQSEEQEDTIPPIDL